MQTQLSQGSRGPALREILAQGGQGTVYATSDPSLVCKVNTRVGCQYDTLVEISALTVLRKCAHVPQRVHVEGSRSDGCVRVYMRRYLGTLCQFPSTTESDWGSALFLNIRPSRHHTSDTRIRPA